MIEEIKLLLPLLQGAADSAVWLIAAYMAKSLLVDLLVFVLLIIAGRGFYRLVLKLNDKDQPKDSRPLHERMNISRERAAFEAVREWWLYGDGGTKAHQMYEELDALVAGRKKP